MNVEVLLVEDDDAIGITLLVQRGDLVDIDAIFSKNPATVVCPEPTCFETVALDLRDIDGVVASADLHIDRMLILGVGPVAALLLVAHRLELFLREVDLLDV